MICARDRAVDRDAVLRDGAASAGTGAPETGIAPSWRLKGRSSGRCDRSADGVCGGALRDCLLPGGARVEESSQRQGVGCEDADEDRGSVEREHSDGTVCVIAGIDRDAV